jgi:3D (Asp-Asp-Asp) domain-containing protein
MALLRRPFALACLSACGAAALLAPGPASARKRHRHSRHAEARRPLSRPTWLSGVELTEYYPVPERWFVGRPVTAPGLREPHRIDWLYSARGVSMEGDGIALDGREFHIERLGKGGWINAEGHRTRPGRPGWTRGAPFWRAGAYWLTADGMPTFPLENGDWSKGPGVRYVALDGVTFASGPSRHLRYYRSVAVDPRLIPRGSRIYIPAYRGRGASNGWFVAEDTGGAIRGRHLDIYRPPPESLSDQGADLLGQRVYVVPPGRPLPPWAGGSPPGGATPPGPSAGTGTPAGGQPAPQVSAPPTPAGSGGGTAAG